MNKRISQLVAGGFAILIILGLATNIFLTLAVEQAFEEQQHIEATAIEARAATRSLRADFLEMGGAVGAALLDPALKEKFQEFWARKQKSDANADAHLQKAMKYARHKELLRLLKQLKAHDDSVTEPLEWQLFVMAKTDVNQARRFYITRYLPAQEDNIKISAAALKVATQHVLDLQEEIRNRAAFAQSIARRAILAFVLLGISSAFVLTRSVGVIARQSEKSQEQLRTQAMFDGLTGLMNRTAITGFLTREMERAAREGQSLSIVLLDLDHFKQVNDRHGHAAGDAVLKEAAKRMKNSMRSYDEVGRYGGEEFLIVAPGCTQENVPALAERVRLAIDNAPIDCGEIKLPVSCSLGAAAKADGQKENIEAFIARADAALYKAKESGRNRTELALEQDVGAAEKSD